MEKYKINFFRNDLYFGKLRRRILLNFSVGKEDFRKVGWINFWKLLKGIWGDEFYLVV